MAPPLLVLQDIRLRLGGGAPLLESADLSVRAGERLCLVGRNGSGKSTLLKIAAGEIEADAGTRFLQPNVSVRYLPQEPDLSTHANVRDFALAGLGPTDDPHRVQFLLEQLGLTGDEDPARLSGGEARRAALARVLAPQPDILLLDEPTNHLDLPAIEWLEQELGQLRAALVLISHDRRFLSNLSRTTVWLDRGRARRIESGFAEFEAWRDKILEEEELERHKLDRKIAMEEDWLRYGVTARRRRNQGRLDKLQTLRRRQREERLRSGSLKLEASGGRTSGNLVIEAEGLTKSFDGRPVVAGLSLRLMRGERLGIVGPNGAGKSTLLALLTGERAPDEGQIRLGANLQIASLDQRRTRLDPQTTLSDALTGGGSDYVTLNGQPRHVIGYMRDFLFQPEQARTPLGRLSGGERGRLALAIALARPSNLLVLDEPTNDLDLETLDLLQDFLSDYPGTLLLVSHDRDFLDRITTSVLVAEGFGRWIEYAGGYTDMLAQRGVGAPQPASLQAVSGVESEAPAIRPSARRRLSFKDKHALSILPRTIEDLRTQTEGLKQRLSDPMLYQRDAQAFAALSEAFAVAEAALVNAENEWLRLEILREEVEQ
jgi:ATP-binding cassette subfamily F protein uup